MGTAIQAAAGQNDPAAYGVSFWTMPPLTCTNVGALGSGTFVAVRSQAVGGALINKLGLIVGTAAVAPSTGVNGLALYTAAGVLLSATGDISASLTATGFLEGTLTTPQAVAAGQDFYIAVLTHMTGNPSIAANTITSTNYLPVRSNPSSVFIAAQASFPASFNPGAATNNNGAYFLTAGT